MTNPRSSPHFMVVDAGVSLKWVLDDGEEVGPSVALRNRAIRDGILMLAPSLWMYEVTNAMTVARLQGRIGEEQSRQAVTLLRECGIRLVDPEPRECQETAVDLGISGYDAAYVSLAGTVDAEFWTADRRLWEQANGSGVAVRWIGDFQP